MLRRRGQLFGDPAATLRSCQAAALAPCRAAKQEARWLRPVAAAALEALAAALAAADTRASRPAVAPDGLPTRTARRRPRLRHRLRCYHGRGSPLRLPRQPSRGVEGKSIRGREAAIAGVGNGNSCAAPGWTIALGFSCYVGLQVLLQVIQTGR